MKKTDKFFQDLKIPKNWQDVDFYKMLKLILTFAKSDRILAKKIKQNKVIKEKEHV